MHIYLAFCSTVDLALFRFFQAAALGASATLLRGHHLEVAFDAGHSCMFAMKLQGLIKIQDGFVAVIDYK